MLRATTACAFSTSQLPKVVREWCVLYILTWKCASRHNGVHFFISHLARCLRTRRFSEATFRPSGATNHWKNTVNRDFPTFSRICIFFLLTLSLLIFSLLIFSLLTLLTSAFQLSILSEVSLLNFLRLSSLSGCIKCISPVYHSVSPYNCCFGAPHFCFLPSVILEYHSEIIHSNQSPGKKSTFSQSHRIHGAAIYGNMNPIHIPPVMLALIYQHHGSVMGI